MNRETWLAQGGEPLPDGPSDRGKVRYVLPDFGELVDEQIWFGANLVDGYQSFKLPLRTVKHAGNVAARLLLALYAANDMDMWGGVLAPLAYSGETKLRNAGYGFDGALHVYDISYAPEDGSAPIRVG